MGVSGVAAPQAAPPPRRADDASSATAAATPTSSHESRSREGGRRASASAPQPPTSSSVKLLQSLPGDATPGRRPPPMRPAPGALVPIGCSFPPPPVDAPTPSFTSMMRTPPAPPGSPPAPPPPRKEPLRMASSRSCARLSASRSSATGTRRSSTASLALLSRRSASSSPPAPTSTSMTTWRGSVKTCSHPGLPRTDASRSLRTDPRPRIMMRVDVERSRDWRERPRGPSSRPTKLVVGYRAVGMDTLARLRMSGALPAGAGELPADEVGDEGGEPPTPSGLDGAANGAAACSCSDVMWASRMESTAGSGGVREVRMARSVSSIDSDGMGGRGRGHTPPPTAWPAGGQTAAPSARGRRGRGGTTPPASTPQTATATGCHRGRWAPWRGEGGRGENGATTPTASPRGKRRQRRPMSAAASRRRPRQAAQ
ncbi:hypothetical protein BU14_0617s0010 [Porphyra umbilicalis]|uniref:Uncharacterized protein n=1 Tax=Porphyra umbilicalis TaxID=2786 RepID=A0A1X6NR79_PORUM|nr:hypothetical protein BU14_0617s0010 [Porphyra umbilicalis]|eukprot:OSX71006.1 hypothetical protein BU14_0617s0010 [Porphyra umbilicalis]